MFEEAGEECSATDTDGRAEAGAGTAGLFGEAAGMETSASDEPAAGMTGGALEEAGTEEGGCCQSDLFLPTNPEPGTKDRQSAGHWRTQKWLLHM